MHLCVQLCTLSDLPVCERGGVRAVPLCPCVAHLSGDARSIYLFMGEGVRPTHMNMRHVMCLCMCMCMCIHAHDMSYVHNVCKCMCARTYKEERQEQRAQTGPIRH